MIFSGHSLGGAVADIAAMDAIQKGGYLRDYLNPDNVHVITLGSPRVGNGHWAEAWANSGVGNVYRIVNSTVIVVLIVRILFHHCLLVDWVIIIMVEKSI